jgi:hypothetical protein
MPVKLSALPFRPHALVLALALASGAASAATLTVSGSCTLLNAIHNANTDTDTDGTGGCSAGNGADIIKLKANSVYTLSSPDNYADGEGENALPSITSTITLNGNGATLQRASTADTPDFRFLHIAANGNLTLDKLTLRNGNLDGDYFYGGAILNHGTLTISNSQIDQNQVDNGGGIANLGGTLALSNTQITANRAAVGGGIITVNGTTTLMDSSVSGNKAFIAGGMMNDQATVSLSNSTISNNKANDGGGISNNQATVTLSNSTLSGNKAQQNGGIGNFASTLTASHNTIAKNQGGGLNNQATAILTNNLIAGNSNGDCLNSGAVILKGSNWIEDGSCNATLSGNINLDALLDNGGVTATHAIYPHKMVKPTSAALCPATDQRHVSRPQTSDKRCDIGAIEQIRFIPAPVTDIMQIFQGLLASGNLRPTLSTNLGMQQLNALMNQFLVAGDLRAHHQKPLACSQLQRSAARIDPDHSPEADDYATGDQAVVLLTAINDLYSTWKCP